MKTEYIIFTYELRYFDQEYLCSEKTAREFINLLPVNARLIVPVSRTYPWGPSSFVSVERLKTLFEVFKANLDNLFDLIAGVTAHEQTNQSVLLRTEDAVYIEQILIPVKECYRFLYEQVCGVYEHLKPLEQTLKNTEEMNATVRNTFLCFLNKNPREHYSLETQMKQTQERPPDNHSHVSSEVYEHLEQTAKLLKRNTTAVLEGRILYPGGGML
tara:strand:+ start:337 stop:981 length:645 start_codon:yes stop_codon:yes gene_type:complete